MARDLYRAIHKAMRKDLFEVSSLFAATDFEEAAEVDALRQRFAGLVASMEHHSEMEDDSIHPLAREIAPDVVADIEAEHTELDPELSALQTGLAELEPGGDSWNAAHDLYLRFNRFLARYLLHIEREERELMPRLATADQSLIEDLARKDYEGPAEMLVSAVSAMLPLFNTDDRREILSDIEATRNSEDYAQITEAAERVLGPERWARLHR